ncbi:hypothetical protein Taro_013840, partial [Colocasia esculenta]|nr:hypothetical protein [Colocasia esculenta]
MLSVYRRGEAVFMMTLCGRAIIDSRIVQTKRGLDQYGRSPPDQILNICCTMRGETHREFV